MIGNNRQCRAVKSFLLLTYAHFQKDVSLVDLESHISALMIVTKDPTLCLFAQNHNFLSVC